MGALQMVAAKKEGVFTAVERSPRRAANPVANLVAEDGTEHNGKQDPFEWDDSGGGKNAGCNEQGISREKKADEKSRLDENNNANEKGASLTNQSFHIVNGVEQVADGFEQWALVL
ncbi:MAG: hypothetical protein PVS2B2_10760 [Candidatus Acidiferrum sp.]